MQTTKFDRYTTNRLHTLCSKAANTIALVLLVTVFCVYADKSSSGKFVVLSDIHAFAPSDGGPGDQSGPASCPSNGKVSCTTCDSNDHDTKAHLFESMLKDLACTAPKPKFVIITGDWIAHHYLSRGHEQKKKTIMTKLTQALQQQFGKDTLLIPALGNNDAYNGDYQIKARGKFLKDMKILWEPLFPDTAQLGSCDGASAQEFDDSFMAGGYYAFQNPHLANNCTIVLNSVMFMQNFVNSSRWGSQGKEAGHAQLDWLADQLKRAGTKKIWLAYHVPPGVDAFGSSAHRASSMFTKEFTARFLKLMHDYGPNIEAAFAGHTHLDSFRLLNHDGTPESWVHITPSVTPDHHTGRSAYQIFDYKLAAHGKSTVIDDYVTRYLNFRNPGTAIWNEEYTWKKTFCHADCTYDLSSLNWLYDRLDEHPWDTYYQRILELRDLTSSSPIMSDAKWRKFYCAIGNQRAREFTSCVQNLTLTLTE